MNRKKFSHLTYTQRLQLEALLRVKTPKMKIAEILGIHDSTVYRELKRGKYERKKIHSITVYGDKKYKLVEDYSPELSQQKYDINKTAKGSPLKIEKDFTLANYIERKIINEKMSPAAVLGEIKHNNICFETSICVNTLYSYIDKGVFLNLSVKNLPNKHSRKRVKRKLTVKRAPKGISIEKRPEEIKDRNTFGHWEMDCVCGSTLPVLLVLTERLTRKEIIIRMKDQTAKSVVSCIDSLERKYGKNFSKVFKSITVDNGSEFSDCKSLERSVYSGNRTTMYYCHPYSSYERGTNERFNREIRRKFPKGTNFLKVSNKDVKEVERWLNNYPRRILGWACSEELYLEQLRQIC